MKYIPRPIDTSDVQLPPELEPPPELELLPELGDIQMQAFL